MASDLNIFDTQVLMKSLGKVTFSGCGFTITGVTSTLPMDMYEYC